MKSKNNIAFIYTALPAYMFKCIEELAKNSSYDISVIETSSNKNYPVKFHSNLFNIYNYDDLSSIKLDRLFSQCSILFVSGWANKTIVNLTNHWYKKGIKLCLLNDQPKKNNFRQFLGRYKLRNYLNQFDTALVPGIKAKDLLRYYGFKKEKIKIGLYSCDTLAFRKSYEERNKLESYPKRFLFDGQLIKRKGIPFLVNEYSDYLKRSKASWKLTVIGKGELNNIIPDYIDKHGFVHPDDVPSIYAKAGCFVLTSHEDHWPLVVHQAVSSGLPILLSKNCFNKYEFYNGQNGFLIDPANKGSLTEAMFKIEALEEKNLKLMGEVSLNLSKEYNIEKWVILLRDIIEMN